MAMAMAMSTTADTSSRWSLKSLSCALPSLNSSKNCSSLRFSTAPRRQRGLTLTRSRPTNIQSFTNTFSLSLGFSDCNSFGNNFSIIDNGSRIYAMRHGRRVPKLNRPPDQRRALLRGLTTQLLKHGRIKTTRARASAVRKYVDKMITLAKDGSLHKRRQALGFIYEKQIVHALFAEVPDRYGERNGGYTRITRTLPRRGDNAPMAFIELV
ncbi:hypothetical protein Ddye_008767 [Dipteronia dyeriana]|uniref:Large ribosomal subunit protein bL17c n=1 Tax=Dipteronia dyeriana TaxID=168575 RepID=A0AAD9XAE5_9ROSI|nr:hypothetical protein Ddye_008767 [Dipteronia dyeriana]